MKGYITINVDASFHPQHKVAGYAFWIVCDTFKLRTAASFNKDPETARDAEIMAIANAVATLYRRKDLPVCHTLIINNDCKFAHTEIKANKTRLAIECQRHISKLVHLLQCKWEFRYVKAHNGHPDARSFVNDWCDQAAKTEMRKKLKTQIE